MEALLTRFLADYANLGLVDLGTFLSICLVDAAFSADNSILINALASGIKERSTRVRVIWCGMAFAAVLRVVALCFAAFIMSNAWVQILGALYLWKISYAYFCRERTFRNRKEKANIFMVFVSIGILDLTLSFDNIIGVFALSQNLVVVVAGVMVSILMLAVATQVVRKLMERYALVEPAAYLILVSLGAVILLDKGAEFLVWLGALILANHDTIVALSFRIGDKWKTAGVMLIILTAIGIEEVRRYLARRKNK